MYFLKVDFTKKILVTINWILFKQIKTLYVTK